MTQFIDLRLSAVGGELARTVAVNQGTNIGDYTGLSQSALLDSIKGQNVLIATHGFNVNRADGISCLSNWASLLQLPQSSAFVGLLWPGDSVWAHGLDYPGEALVANQAGSMAAEFINANLRQAASVSFASHSLGARVVLSTISNLSLPVRRLLLMAPAIDDDCLTTEFQTTAAKIGAISVLSSKKDEVLSVAFPLGNLFAGIIAEGQLPGAIHDS
jgi:esterase/lipase superfamily enzyme